MGTKEVSIYLQSFSDDNFIKGVLKVMIMRDKESALLPLEAQALKDLLMIEERASVTDG